VWRRCSWNGRPPDRKPKCFRIPDCDKARRRACHETRSIRAGERRDGVITDAIVEWPDLVGGSIPEKALAKSETGRHRVEVAGPPLIEAAFRKGDTSMKLLLYCLAVLDFAITPCIGDCLVS
jgi:hypothetical protein